MDHGQLLISLRAAVASRDAAVFAPIAESTHPADIATALAGLEPEEVCALLARMPAPARAALFGYLDAAAQVAVAACLERTGLAELFLHMPPDERADLFNRLPEGQREALLPALARVEREDIRKLARFPEGTVGAVMTSEYATLTPGLNPPEAIDHLRKVAPDTETIYQAYVVDENRKLVGVVSLKDLIVAPSQAQVGELMNRAPVFVRAAGPRGEAARLISKYDFIALPVTDDDDRLVGIITYDDAMDVAEAQATVQFGKVGAVEELTVRFRDAPVGLLYRKRIFWLVVLVFGNLVSGAGIVYFEDTIAAHFALIFFLPLLIATGGNAGAQSATLMVRALATGDVQPKDWATMLLRELAVGALLGVTMALAVSGIGLWRGGPEIALVVTLTMVLIVIAGSVIGMSLPFVLSRLHLDPAASSAPLVTSIADAVGVILYFILAAALLEMPGLPG